MSQRLERMRSMAYNQIVSGLSGTTTTLNISLEELEDEIIATRIALIHKYALQNILHTKDLYRTIDCLKVDCKSMSDCCAAVDDGAETYPHFTVPQICFTAGDECILWLGSTDKLTRFKWYNSPQFQYHKYKRFKSRKDKPYVYINPSVNNEGMLDCYILNCDFPLDAVSITAIFKNERQLDEFDCCNRDDSQVFSDLDQEVIATVVQKFFQSYRAAIQPPFPIINTPGGAGMQTK